MASSRTWQDFFLTGQGTEEGEDRFKSSLCMCTFYSQQVHTLEWEESSGRGRLEDMWGH